MLILDKSIYKTKFCGINNLELEININIIVNHVNFMDLYNHILNFINKQNIIKKINKNFNYVKIFLMI